MQCVQWKWSSEALTALDDIAAYYNEVAPEACDRVLADIQRAVEDYIVFMPYMFVAAEGDDPTLCVCCLPHPYLIYYRVNDESVNILDVVHAARQHPSHIHTP